MPLGVVVVNRSTGPNGENGGSKSLKAESLNKTRSGYTEKKQEKGRQREKSKKVMHNRNKSRNRRKAKENTNFESRQRILTKKIVWNSN